GRGTAVAIPNGIPQLAPPDSGEVLKELGLEPGRYVLNVARLVPEKRQLDLIEGFSRAGLPGWKLALVGSALNDSSYPASVARAAAEAGNCVMCGTRKGSALSTLYANAGAFVLPSAHEGLPITLLEALSFGLPCIASSIPANREVSLPDDRYFEVGDVDALAQRLKAVALERGSQAVAPIGQSFDMLPAEYQWKTVAVNTATVLLQAAGRPAPATLAGAGGDSVSRMEADSPEARPR
ncbi:MAG: glycosyltransferase family 4 protein, partial [Burkholderiaceae bacterium]|nr:glycosyltransferase family 4 protein [Burkholderiaceae bacterium]